MAQIILRIETEEPQWITAVPNIEKVTDEIKKAAFDYVEKFEHLDIFKIDKPLIVNLCLSNDAHIQQLNHTFRNMDKPTNVLSFANIDFAAFDLQNKPFDEVELGDIIIAYETMVKEAEIEHITLYAHFCHLLAHGILHILGYDHVEEIDAEHMEMLEKEILKTLDIADPYGEKDER